MNRNPTKLYTSLLLLPCLTFLPLDHFFSSLSYFLLIIALMVISYLSYNSSFKNPSYNIVRKCVGCLGTSLLIVFLVTELNAILVGVYKVEFGEEVMFVVKMIVMLSNMEANLELCSKTEEEYQELPTYQRDAGLNSQL